MSRKKETAPEEVTPAIVDASASLAQQHQALMEDWSPPSLVASLASLEASLELPDEPLSDEWTGDEELRMKPLPARSDKTPPNIPSIHLLTGLLSGEATSEERELWDEHYAGNDKAQSRLKQMEQWTGEAPDIAHERDAMLARGQALREGLSPLPMELLVAFGTTEDGAEAETGMAEVYVEDVADAVAIAPPMCEDDGPAGASDSGPGLLDWLKWGTPALLTLCWFLAVQLPHGQPDPLLALPGAKRQPLIYQPPQATAAPKGAQRTKPSARVVWHAPQIAMYLRRQRRPIRLDPKVPLHSKDGDQVRFFVRNANQMKLYVHIFLVEQDGTVTHLYPTAKARAFVLPVSPGGQYLQGGTELSAATRPERIFACVSKRPIAKDEIQRSGASMGRRSLVGVASSSLSCVYQTSWLLMPANGPKRPHPRNPGPR